MNARMRIVLRIISVQAALVTACATVIPLGGTASTAQPDAGDDGTSAADGSAADAGRDAAPCRSSPAGTTMRVLNHAGLARQYVVSRAASVDPCGGMPAIFAFHGLGSSATATGEGARRTLLLEAAERARALAIFVEGSVGARGETGWSCSGCADFEAADDVGLVRSIVAELGIDATRVSAIGVDLGGSFVHRLAAELPLAAGAALAGALGAAPGGMTSNIVRPVAKAPTTFIISNGEGDPIFPFNGGVSNRGDAETSFADAVAFWRTASGCVATPTVRTTALTTTETYACNGVEIISARWPAAKHVIPEVDPNNEEVSFVGILDRLLAER